jgi:predicted cupin superfamily sugar epimerase
MLTSEQMIRLLELKPLTPEGGYYRETYRSDETMPPGALPTRYRGGRSVGAAIYFLLTPDTFSAMHRLSTDEVYHFYLGDPVELIELSPGASRKTVTLGHNILHNMVLQHVVRRDTWQALRLIPGGRLALLGTTTAPGFDQADYEHGDRNRLLAEYPGAEDLIRALTR